MVKNNTPDVPGVQTSNYVMGNNSSSLSKNGNNWTTQFNPSMQEQQSYNLLENKLPSLYDTATTPQDFQSYVDNYTNNQKAAVNQDLNNGLKLYKANLQTSGQGGSTEGINKLRPINESYLKQMSDIEANAPILANTLRNNDLAYNTSILNNVTGGLDSFYNLGNTFNKNALSLAGYGQDVAQRQYADEIQNYQLQQAAKQQSLDNLATIAKYAVAIGGTPFTGGASLGILGLNTGVKK